MKTFMAIYTASPAAFERYQKEHPTPEQRQAVEKAGMEAWKKWATDNAQSIVDLGAPLGKTKRITRDGVADFRNSLTAYTVVRAESHEAAARLFVGHPHFTVFPGDGVELMECLPMPG